MSERDEPQASARPTCSCGERQYLEGELVKHRNLVRQLDESASRLDGALLTARERAEKAEALVSTLKAECRAWRAFDWENWPLSGGPTEKEHKALRDARTATDALLGKERL